MTSAWPDFWNIISLYHFAFLSNTTDSRSPPHTTTSAPIHSCVQLSKTVQFAQIHEAGGGEVKHSLSFDHIKGVYVYVYVCVHRIQLYDVGYGKLEAF